MPSTWKIVRVIALLLLAFTSFAAIACANLPAKFRSPTAIALYSVLAAISLFAVVGSTAMIAKASRPPS